MWRAWFLAPMTLSVGCETEASPPDDTVVYGILDLTAFLYNQNVLGTPIGPQDLTVDCTLGGSAHLVGATTDDGTIATVDLVYSLTGCRNSDSTFDLTIEGAVDVDGSFSGSGFKAMAYTATGLEVSGDAEGQGVDEICDLAVFDEAGVGEEGRVSGTWCGRDVSF